MNKNILKSKASFPTDSPSETQFYIWVIKSLYMVSDLQWFNSHFLGVHSVEK